MGVEVIGIQYPGRGRNQEPLLSKADDIVSALLTLLPPSLDLDYAFFGHSNGALLAFELARSLGSEHRERLRHQFVSASPAPHLPRVRRGLSGLSDEEVLRKVRDMGGTPPALLADAELMRRLLPRLRADFEVGDAYVFRPGRRLACELTLLRGSLDRAVDESRVSRWAELTTGRCKEHVIEGGHFFLTTHTPQVVELVGATLSDRVLQQEPERTVRS